MAIHNKRKLVIINQLAIQTSHSRKSLYSSFLLLLHLQSTAHRHLLRERGTQGWGFVFTGLRSSRFTVRAGVTRATVRASLQIFPLLTHAAAPLPNMHMPNGT